jgi:hypothetical protein
MSIEEGDRQFVMNNEGITSLWANLNPIQSPGQESFRTKYAFSLIEAADDYVQVFLHHKSNNKDMDPISQKRNPVDRVMLVLVY